MRWLILLIILTCTSTSLNAQRTHYEDESEKLTTKEQGLKGRVKWYKNGDKLFLYDEKGRLIYERKRWPLTKGFQGRDTIVFWEQSYLYNKRGLMTLMNGTWILNKKFRYIYNSNGDLLETNTYSEHDSLISRTVTHYNKKGDRYDYILADGKEKLLCVYKYDSRGDLADYSEYDHEGNLNYHRTEKHNNKHQPI